MNYKVVIDPGHGGNDLGNVGNDVIEKDYALLISNYIKQRLDDLGIDNIITRNTDRNLSDDERVNIIESTYGLDDNVLVVSNHLNKGGLSGVEIIYALRNDDDFAEEISKQIISSGGVLNKYYQLRDPDDTAFDFYSLIRNTPNYETVMIEYGYVDNVSDANKIKNNYSDYAEAVVRAIAVYTGNKYVPVSGDNIYVVKKGDSLWKIANSYGISVSELKSANNLSSNILNIGQILNIPVSGVGDENVYIVKSGDSLYSIARKYGISVDELKNVNNLTNDLLSIGQKLVIPIVGNESVDIYVVKSGDSLYSIAKKYGVSVNELKKVNNLTSNLLSIGQKLVIPDDNQIYIVKSGDSLYSIAKRYGVSVDELKNVNKLTSNLLGIGQKLIIP